MKDTQIDECTHFIFDVDWTLVAPIIGTGRDNVFRKTASDWKFLPGRVERIRELKARGAKISLATVQGGVALGIFGPYPQGEAAMSTEIHRVAYEIGADFVGISFTFPGEKADPHYRDMNDFDRKPNPGLLLKAMIHCKVGPNQTIMVGDRDEDCFAAQNAACGFRWANEFFAEEKKEEAV